MNRQHVMPTVELSRGASVVCAASPLPISTGSAFEHAYSAEQALRRYEERLQEARCPMCGAPLGAVRLRWYGADYCGEECLRRGRQAQWETTQEDKFWESPRSARMGLWPY